MSSITRLTIGYRAHHHSGFLLVDPKTLTMERQANTVEAGDFSINTVGGDQEKLIVGQEEHHYPLPVIPALYSKLLLLVRSSIPYVQFLFYLIFKVPFSLFFIILPLLCFCLFFFLNFSLSLTFLG